MMVAKRKTAKRKGKRKAGSRRPMLMPILKSMAVVCVLAAVPLGILYWDTLIKPAAADPNNPVPLELSNEPTWVNQELEQKLYRAANADGRGLTLDESAAKRVQQNIETIFAWLGDVRVRTMHDRLSIEGRWRKPLVLVKSGLDSFYVDRELVVLDLVPVPKLNIVKVKGLAAAPARPVPGLPWHQEDLAAAVELIELLNKWDAEKTPHKPLLKEIASIDVDNYNGRKNSRLPHIVLYTTDDTEIKWGAELGKWQRHLEATDAEKLAKLYAYYEELGSLLGDVKYINLSDPQNRISLPIDME